MKCLDSGDVSDHPYQTQFEAFFASVQRKRMPLTDIKDALRTHQILFAADVFAAHRYQKASVVCVARTHQILFAADVKSSLRQMCRLKAVNL